MASVDKPWGLPARPPRSPRSERDAADRERYADELPVQRRERALRSKEALCNPAAHQLFLPTLPIAPFMPVLRASEAADWLTRAYTTAVLTFWPSANVGQLHKLMRRQSIRTLLQEAAGEFVTGEIRPHGWIYLHLRGRPTRAERDPEYVFGRSRVEEFTASYNLLFPGCPLGRKEHAQNLPEYQRIRKMHNLIWSQWRLQLVRFESLPPDFTDDDVADIVDDLWRGRDWTVAIERTKALSVELSNRLQQRAADGDFIWPASVLAQV